MLYLETTGNAFDGREGKAEEIGLESDDDNPVLEQEKVSLLSTNTYWHYGSIDSLNTDWALEGIGGQFDDDDDDYVAWCGMSSSNTFRTHNTEYY